ncbi:hypothetical protein LCGC14_1123120 [marine sediment metagenome]|uniref:Calcineurin-like phosphoesterase domain-containing protein n=1 Tax=marine sediment metagenome TaxID=412755 RepID=A0A0F9Q988_9ZZZZ
MKKRPVDIVVISDVHLGTYGCHAKELAKYLKSIHPKKVILNGDIIDIWQFNKRYWPKSHMKVIKLLMAVNFCSKKLGKEPVSMSKKIKNGVKSAIKFIHNFERTAADIAIENNYDYVVCGHIHHPEIKSIETPNGSVAYLNSGDWVENLTALEYHKGKWKLYRYEEDVKLEKYNVDIEDPIEILEKEELFQRMMSEFNDLSADRRHDRAS